jgi:hypothetical protein
MPTKQTSIWPPSIAAAGTINGWQKAYSEDGFFYRIYLTDAGDRQHSEDDAADKPVAINGADRLGLLPTHLPSWPQQTLKKYGNMRFVYATY